MRPIKTPIAGISFDLDNTLWDSEVVLARAHRAMLCALESYRPVSAEPCDEALWKQLRAGSLLQMPDLTVSARRRALLARVLTCWQVPEPMRIVETLFEVFYALRQQVTYYPETQVILERLSRSYHLIGITNGNACLRATGLDRWLKYLVSADQIGVAKPKAEPFQHALALMQCPPEAVVHVGDDPIADVWGAQQVGMQTIWLNREGRPWLHGDFAPSCTVLDLIMFATQLERLE